MPTGEKLWRWERLLQATYSRCVWLAWLTAWVTAIFLSSALMAAFGLSIPARGIGQELSDLPAATWKVADDVGPAAKLLLGFILLIVMPLSNRSFRRAKSVQLIGNAAAGAFAMTATLLLVPSTYSRGFGIGLTGARFDGATFPLYFLAGIAAGIMFTIATRRCQAKNAAAHAFRGAVRP